MARRIKTEQRVNKKNAIADEKKRVYLNVFIKLTIHIH